MKPSTLLKAILILMLILVYCIVDSKPAYMGPGKKILEKSTDSIINLELDGKIEKSDIKTPATYTVILIQHNKPIKSTIVKEGKNFSFALKQHSWYAIAVKKEGHVSKLISVNTEVPHSKYHYESYKLSFAIGELISHDEAKHLDSDAIDFPIAIVAFDQQKEAFYINEEYFDNIRREVLATLLPSK